MEIKKALVSSTSAPVFVWIQALLSGREAKRYGEGTNTQKMLLPNNSILGHTNIRVNKTLFKITKMVVLPRVYQDGAESNFLNAEKI